MASVRQQKKSRFVKAFARIGTITGAAKASRVSRDAVYDWIKNDESFVRQFAHAKRQHDNEPFQSLDTSLTFFTDLVKPIIPVSVWPKVASTLALAIANLKNDLKGGRRTAIPLTGEVAEFSLSPSRFEEVALLNCERENSANDL